MGERNGKARVGIADPMTCVNGYDSFRLLGEKRYVERWVKH